MSVVPYPQTDKHINQHTHNYTPIETQHIINEPTVPYLQARCTNKTNTIKARIHNLSENGDPHSSIATILEAHKLNTISTHAQLIQAW